MANKKLISIVISVIIALIAWVVPANVYGIDGLTVVEQRVIAIFILAALLWITEPIPIWTTSVFIMVLMLVSVSTSSIKPLSNAQNYESLGPVSGDTKLLLADGSYASVIDLYNKYQNEVGEKDSVCVKPVGAKDKDKPAKITGVEDVQVKSVTNFAFANGKSLNCTPDLKLTKLVKGEEKVVTANLLKVGDTLKGGKDAPLAIASIREVAAATAYKIKVSAPEKAYSFECGTSIKSEKLGTLIKYKDIMAAFADPIVMLFLGGFVLAIAAGKIGLDGQLAKTLLKPFGRDPKIVMLGFLLVTGVFSMFMSNTATAAMMLAIMAPVFKSMQNEDGSLDKGVVGLAMAIPIGANIGGMGTPIGTPPNGVAMKYLNGAAGEGLDLGIGFAQWMLVMVPLVLIIFAFAWFLLVKMYPFSTKEITLKIDNEAFGKADPREKKIICTTFAVTVLLWVTDKFTGINANVVALIPFAVLTVTGVFKKSDLSLIDWDVLWLVAGGFALGVGLEKTGLAKHMVEAIPFGQWSPIIVMLGSGLLCLIMSTFMSNSASAALLLPIMFTVSKGMDLGAYGGAATMLIGVALSASLAMALPISTPPNALAYSTDMVKQKDMATVGIIVGIFGFALAYFALIYVAGPMGLFIK